MVGPAPPALGRAEVVGLPEIVRIRPLVQS